MLPVVAAFLVAAAVAAVAGVLYAKQNHSGGTTPDNAARTNPATLAPSGTNAARTSPSQTATPTSTTPADEQCTDQIKANKRWVCLTKATFDGDKITIEYEANFAGATPNVSGGFHLHIYGGDGTNPAEGTEGSQSSTPGRWYVEDENPSVRRVTSNDFMKAIGLDAPKVCARIANSKHQLVPDDGGGFHTGNCIPIDRTG
jgi:hypothetical protein